jgi:hypothetical protein
MQAGESNQANVHERVREWIALGAAEALERAEDRELAAHLALCADCSAELEQWRDLTAALRRLPTPQAPAALVERVRARMAAHAIAEAEQRGSRWVLFWLVLFAWTTTLAAWPVLRLVSDGTASWLDLRFLHTWYGLTVFTAVSWIAAGTAAAVLGLRHRQTRGLA